MILKFEITLLTLLLFAGLGTAQLFAQDSTATDSTTVQQRNSSIDKELLEKFREAFNKVVKNEAEKRQQATASKDPELILNGFVLNETLTRMGNNFYNLFYQYWQPPDSINYYYNIVVSEKPAPGIGSLLNININNKTVVKSRLQPKYSYLEALSKQAVRRIHQILQQKASVRKQLAGF